MFRLSTQENERKGVLIPLSSTFLDWNRFELHKFHLLILHMYMYFSAAVETWNDAIDIFLVGSALRPSCPAIQWQSGQRVIFFYFDCDL